jgi:hypothetical protein
MRRLRAVPLDVTPIVGLVGPAPGLADWHGIVDEITRAAPALDVTAEDGIRHRLWRAADPRTVARATRPLEPAAVVIADGHHRYAAALASRADRGDDRVLMYLVDGRRQGPRILPVHRIVRRLPSDLADRLAVDFTTEPAPAEATALTTAVAACDDTVFGLRTAEGALLLRPRDLRGLRAGLPTHRPARWRALDPAVLALGVLPGLGVADADVEAVGDLVGAVAAVERGEAAGVFVLQPVALDDVVDLALDGHLMPPKSTWFRPKPRAGLLMRAADSRPWR